MKTSWFLMAIGLSVPVLGDEPGVVGRRPYELDWAHRTADDHPPLVDFEKLTGWQVACEDARASVVPTREQQIWDRFVAKVTYRGCGRLRAVPGRDAIQRRDRDGGQRPSFRADEGEGL